MLLAAVFGAAGAGVDDGVERNQAAGAVVDCSGEREGDVVFRLAIGAGTSAENHGAIRWIAEVAPPQRCVVVNDGTNED